MPFLVGSVTPASVEELLTGLVTWMRNIYLRYPDARQSLPECWLWHPEVIEELLWLRTSWLTARHAAASSSAVSDWHERHRPGVVRRIRDYAGMCSLDQHTPGADRYAGAPTVPFREAVPAIAAWWTTASTEPAPVPAADQLHVARRQPPLRARL
jgi:hypothetical protein